MLPRQLNQSLKVRLDFHLISESKVHNVCQNSNRNDPWKIENFKVKSTSTHITSFLRSSKWVDIPNQLVSS